MMEPLKSNDMVTGQPNIYRKDKPAMRTSASSGPNLPRSSEMEYRSRLCKPPMHNTSLLPSGLEWPIAFFPALVGKEDLALDDAYHPPPKWRSFPPPHHSDWSPTDWTCQRTMLFKCETTNFVRNRACGICGLDKGWIKNGGPNPANWSLGQVLWPSINQPEAWTRSPTHRPLLGPPNRTSPIVNTKGEHQLSYKPNYQSLQPKDFELIVPLRARNFPPMGKELRSHADIRRAYQHGHPPGRATPAQAARPAQVSRNIVGVAGPVLMAPPDATRPDPFDPGRVKTLHK